MTSEANQGDMDDRTTSSPGKSFSISVRVFIEHPWVWQLLWMKEEFGPLFLPSAPEPAKMLLGERSRATCAGSGTRDPRLATG
jgi:hypothetical protein